jgi:hypothetical protein
VSGKSPGGRALASVLKTILYALIFAFVVGFGIGTILRSQLERPIRYIGSQMDPMNSGGLAIATDPWDIANPLARVLMTSNDEEQV